LLGMLVRKLREAIRPHVAVGGRGLGRLDVGADDLELGWRAGRRGDRHDPLEHGIPLTEHLLAAHRRIRRRLGSFACTRAR